MQAAHDPCGGHGTIETQLSVVPSASATRTKSTSREDLNDETTRCPPLPLLDNSQDVHQVVVIGGGVSGLAAAARLHSARVSDVKILESRGRLGGRVVAINIDGIKLQLGAMWIHGVLGNPMYDLASRHGLVNTLRPPTTHNMLACLSNGRRIPFSLVQEVYETYSCFVGRCCEYFLSDSDPPAGVMSVGEHLQLEIGIYLQQTPADQRHVRSALFRHLVDRETVISGCHNMHQVDLSTFGSYCELPGGNVVPDGGYSALLAPLRDRLPADCVRLQQTVVGVSVDNNSGSDDVAVSVRCDNGAVFRARHVVCTLPLGVLQHSADAMFRPAWSERRRAAVRRLGFGTVNKILLMYERSPLPIGVTELLLCWDDQPSPPPSSSSSGSLESSAVAVDAAAAREGHGLAEEKAKSAASRQSDTNYSVPMQQRWFRRIYSFMRVSDTVLMAWLSGDEARYAETLPPHEIGRTCTELLARFLDDPSVPRPKHTVCTSWHSQPCSRGAYTYLPVGASPRDIETISEPVCDSHGQVSKTGAVEVASQHKSAMPDCDT